MAAVAPGGGGDDGRKPPTPNDWKKPLGISEAAPAKKARHTPKLRGVYYDFDDIRGWSRVKPGHSRYHLYRDAQLYSQHGILNQLRREAREAWDRVVREEDASLVFNDLPEGPPLPPF